jgi:uncharacterized protein YbgA (DUF1722 family)/uncharacterized protein YbbK (DUF523 family)
MEDDKMKEFLKPRIVISKCLEHDKCRYDGSMINNEFIEKLKDYVDFTPVCPEVEIELPIPRQALRIIILDDEEKRLIFSRTGEDITEKMQSFSQKFLQGLNQSEIDGFILKSRSPSCGMKDVKMYKTFGKAPTLPKRTKGIFAEQVLEKFPDRVLEDEGRLSNYNIRESFLINIFTSAFFRKVKEEKNINALIKFHSENKYLLMALSQVNLKKLGKLVGNTEGKKIEQILEEYEPILYKALATMLNTGRNVNMLLHLFGYFSKDLTTKEKGFFLEELEKYRNKKVPFSVPLSLIHSWVVRFENEYLLQQTIFEAFPSELINVTDSGKGV